MQITNTFITNIAAQGIGTDWPNIILSALTFLAGLTTAIAMVLLAKYSKGQKELNERMIRLEEERHIEENSGNIVLDDFEFNKLEEQKEDRDKMVGLLNLRYSIRNIGRKEALNVRLNVSFTHQGQKHHKNYRIACISPASNRHYFDKIVIASAVSQTDKEWLQRFSEAYNKGKSSFKESEFAVNLFQLFPEIDKRDALRGLKEEILIEIKISYSSNHTQTGKTYRISYHLGKNIASIDGSP